MKERECAARYAKALFRDAGSLEEKQTIAKELDAIQAIFVNDRGISLFFSSLQVGLEEKRHVMEKSLSTGLPKISSFLDLLLKKGRIGLLSRIIQQYRSYLDQEEGTLRGTFTHAGHYDENWLSQMKRKWEALLQKRVVLEEKVDPRLISGGIMEVGGKRLDCSVKKQIEQMRNTLMGARE